MIRAGHVIGDMAYFGARDDRPELVDRDAVLAADVYVVIVGFRYGSLVRSRPELSHTEWEFEVASRAGIPRYVYMLGEATEGPSGLFVDVEHAARQAAFRCRLCDDAELTLTEVTTPEGLGEALYQALRDLPDNLQPIWQMPPRNPNFIGRNDELGQIRTGFAGGHVVAVQALRGMGGIGKTHTAIEYAHRNTNDYDLIWWIEAGQPALIIEQFAALGTAMGVPAARDPASTVRAVCAQLRQRQRWLLVFDNAERVEDIRPFLPGGNGHVLITTRRGRFRAIGAVLDLDVFDRVDAVRLLCRRTPRLSQNQAYTLAEELGDLPLALEQAAAYLDQTGLAVEEYLQLLQERAQDMYGRGRIMDHQDTIATLWSLSVARLLELQPEAVDLLKLCAWLAPEPIPIDLFTDRAALATEPLDRVLADPVSTADVIGTLVDHSLVRYTGNALLLHRLMQAVLRRPKLDGQRHPLAVILALLRDALPEAITNAQNNWPRWRQLLPHVLTTTDHHDDAQPVAADDVSWLLDRAAAYIDVIGGASQTTRPLLERALHIRQSIYDPDDIRVADSMHNLGVNLAEGGDKAQARPLLQRALHVREIHYGPDHPNVAESLSWLGNVLNILGDSVTALNMVERALRIQKRVLGPDHPGITAALVHLGLAHMYVGNPARAREYCERALRIRQDAYGSDHPWTANCLNILGRALIDLGEAARARPLFERALHIRESTYGPDHYTVALSLSGLGMTMAELYEFGTARALLERALSIDEFANGPDYHFVVSTLNTLSVVLTESGEPDAGRSLLERAHQIRRSDQRDP